MPNITPSSFFVLLPSLSEIVAGASDAGTAPITTTQAPVLSAVEDLDSLRLPRASVIVTFAAGFAWPQRVAFFGGEHLMHRE